MSDNPNNSPDLLSLGVDTDAGSFAALNAQIDALVERIERLQASDEALASIDSWSALENIKIAAQNGDASLADLTAQVDSLIIEYDKLGQVVATTNAAIASSAPSVSGGGDTGGGGGGDTGGYGGQSGGSLFAIGRGLSIAGRLTGSPALSEAGGLVYLEQGLQRISDVLPKVNEALVESGGLFPGLTEGLVAANVPLAGIVGLLGPLAVLAGSVAVGITLMNDALSASNDNLVIAANALKTEFSAIASDTTDQIQTKLAKATADKAAADAEINRITTSQGGAFAGAQAALPGGDITARIAWMIGSTESGFKAVGAQLDAATKASAAAASQIEGYNNALGNSTVVARTAASNAAMSADEQIKAQLASNAALTGTVASTEKKIEADKLDAAAIEAQLPTLAAAATGSADAAKTFETYKDKLALLRQEIENDTNVILPLLQARAAEADAIKVSQKLIDDKAKFEEADAVRVANFQATQSEAATAFQSAEAQKEATFFQGQGEKWNAYQLSLSEIDTKAQASKTKEIDTYNVAAVRAEQDYREKLEDIQRTSKSKLLKDAANLDASAVQNDLEAKQTQVDTLTESYNTARSRAQENEQTKLTDIDTAAAAERLKRGETFRLAQADELANFYLQRQQAEDNFAAQQAKAEQNFDRSEATQAASFKRQQDALTAKLQADEATIVISSVRQAAAAFSGAIGVGVSIIDGLGSTKPQATTTGTDIGNAIVAGAASVVNNIGSVIRSGMAIAAVNTSGTPIGVADLPNYSGTPSNNIFGNADAYASLNTQQAAFDAAQAESFANTTLGQTGAHSFGQALDLSPSVGNIPHYQEFASGGTIAPYGVGWVGSELVRAGAGGASVTPAGATEPGKGKSFTFSGTVNINGSPAPAELKELVKSAFVQAMEEDMR